MCIMDSSFEPALSANDDVGVIRPMPELPSPGQRWTTKRKASVVEAVLGGWVPIEEVCRLYDLSAEEIVAWERDLNRHGLPGLRATRLQIYRDTDKISCVGSPPRTRYVSERRFRLPR